MDTIIESMITNLTKEQAKHLTEVVQAAIEIELREMKIEAQFQGGHYRDDHEPSRWINEAGDSISGWDKR